MTLSPLMSYLFCSSIPKEYKECLQMPDFHAAFMKLCYEKLRLESKLWRCC